MSSTALHIRSPKDEHLITYLIQYLLITGERQKVYLYIKDERGEQTLSNYIYFIKNNENIKFEDFETQFRGFLTFSELICGFDDEFRWGNKKDSVIVRKVKA